MKQTPIYPSPRMNVSHRLFHGLIGTAGIIALCLAVTPLAADSLIVTENQVTSSPANETTPTLGNDGTRDVLVYTSFEVTDFGDLLAAKIYYQPLLSGQAEGPPVLVSKGAFTDNQLNDVSGDYIVYTAYDSVDTFRGTIMLYQISTDTENSIAAVDFVYEAKIHGNFVVWRQGTLATSAQVWLYEIGSSPYGGQALSVPSEDTSNLQIGDRIVVWSEKNGADFDIVGYDLVRESYLVLSRTGAREIQPSTSGSWVVWQARDIGSISTRIEAFNVDAPPTDPDAFRVVVNDGAWNNLPRIDGDLITYESNATGNWDVYVYRLSTAETFAVTIDPANQFLSDVHGDLVSYVQFNQNAPSPQNPDQDVYVATLLFNSAPVADAGPDQQFRVGTGVTFDGSGSFDDNTPTGSLIYAWSFDSVPVGSSATLSGSDTVSPSFLADLSGTYTVQLIVTDEQGLSSDPDYVVVSSGNLAPTADAGDDQLRVVGDLVSLDGSNSVDPDSDPITYDWTITSAPPGSTATLSGADTAFPNFTPDLEGVYVVTLVVSDFIGPGTPDTVEITAITTDEFAKIQIVLASDKVGSLPVGQVTNGGNQTALGRFLTKAIVALNNGDLAEAIDKLEKAIARTDGCVLRGQPDGNGPGRDWITDCTAQVEVYTLLNEALAAITP